MLGFHPEQPPQPPESSGSLTGRHFFFPEIILCAVAISPFAAAYRALNEYRLDEKGRAFDVSEATVKLTVRGEQVMSVAEGNGPVNALDAALRKALTPHYPQLEAMHLNDYKVRILTPSDATAALTRVMIESRDDQGRTWNTLGVSHNVIDASYNALYDAITYHLLKAGI